MGKRQLYLLLLIVVFGCLWATGTQARDIAMEREISVLDPETRQTLALEVADQLKDATEKDGTRTVPDVVSRTQSDESGREFEGNGGMIAVDQIAKSGNRDTRPRREDGSGKGAGDKGRPGRFAAEIRKMPVRHFKKKDHDYRKSVAEIARNCVRIKKHVADHILITVGDVVILNVPAKKKFPAGARYRIYKYVRSAGNRSSGRTEQAWFEEVGMLKIIKSAGNQNCGSIVSARDVIQKGDVVYVGSPL